MLHRGDTLVLTAAVRWDWLHETFRTFAPNAKHPGTLIEPFLTPAPPIHAIVGLNYRFEIAAPTTRWQIHIVGASGSGTSTLAAALARRLGSTHVDTDNYFWLPSDPPFEHIRERSERQALLGAALAGPGGWVLSGSLCGWGDVFIPLFDLVVFLSLPNDIRMARLAERELRRYGAEAIAPGGPLHAKYEAFMAWAAAYETGSVERNRAMHEQWLAALPCPVLRLDAIASVGEHVDRVLRRLSADA